MDGFPPVDSRDRMAHRVGLEPTTVSLTGSCTTIVLPVNGGTGRTRSDGLPLFRRTLCQLSYGTIGSYLKSGGVGHPNWRYVFFVWQ